MSAEISFTLDWTVWVPSLIAAASLAVSVWQMRKSAKRNTIADLEKKIDRACKALDECEDNLQACGREKDELRREKFALLEQIARLAKPNSEHEGGSEH